MRIAHREFLRVIRRDATCLLALAVAGNAAGAREYATLYSFQGGTDGWNPSGFLVEDKAGNLYGTTTYGGTGAACDPDGCGTVFQLQRPEKQGARWNKVTLHNFDGSDGFWPGSGRLVIDEGGNLYGTTQGGGTSGFYGTVFQLAPPAKWDGSWTFTVLYNFTGGGDGGVPANGLVSDRGGNLYGTTNDGGAYGDAGVGTIFQLAPPTTEGSAWIETTLYSFRQIKDGNEPNDLSIDSEGNLYGTRSADNILCTPSAANHCGSAFELQHLAAGWRMKVLHQFAGGGDGSSPWSGMILDDEGNLFGTTLGYGGNIGNGGGTVFELSPPAGGEGPWIETLLYIFSGGADGAQPLAEPIFGRKGHLYGTAYSGGDSSCNFGQGCGVVFELTPSTRQGSPWIETLLHAFEGGSDGHNPGAGLIVGHDGTYYGTASGGGTSSSCDMGCGTVFEVRPRPSP